MTAFVISSLALTFHDPKSYSVNLEFYSRSLKLSFANNTPDAFEYSDTATCLDTMVSAPGSYTSACRWLTRGRSQQLYACQVVNSKARTSQGLSRAPWQRFSGIGGGSFRPVYVKSVHVEMTEEELKWRLGGGRLAGSDTRVTSLWRHSRCIAPGEKVIGNTKAAVLCSCGATQFGRSNTKLEVF